MIHMTSKNPVSARRPIVVNMISESEFTVQGHGVHTAYKEISTALSKRQDIDLDVNTNRPADIVHIQTVGLYALGRLLRKNGKKVVSAHLVPDSFIGSLRAAHYWKPLGRLWLKFFYGRADLVLACSNMVRDELINDMGLTRVETLYNTVDMSQYKFNNDERHAARTLMGIGQKDFVVIGNGQIQPRKRLDIFIRMAKSMPDAQFIWIGGIPFKQLGADYPAMQKLMKSLPDNCTITGVIPLSEVRKYYLAADLFVLPAMQENHPMCVLEAAGAGIPIILRDIPQYDDTFRGDVFMAKTDDDFIKAAHKIRDDKKLYAQLKEGAKKIAARFDSSAGAKRAVGYYTKVMNEDF